MRRYIRSGLKKKNLSQKDGIDFVLLGIVSILTLFGLLMVYDASVVYAFQNFSDKYFYIKQQALWVIIGCVVVAVAYHLDIRFLQKIAAPLLLMSILLLLLVFIPGLGVSAGGAHRWLRIFGLTIQPTEIIKLSAVIYFSNIFEKNIKSIPFFATVAVTCVIIGLFQRDLGSTIVFMITAFGMYFVAGAPLVYFLTTIPIAAVTVVVFTLTSSYRRKRVLAFLDPFSDPQGYSYHILQVLIALGSGGLFGVGIGQSRQKFAYIPEVTTDSIFAIIGEEFGFLGGVILILLFLMLVLRGFKIAKNAPDNYTKLLASGIIIWLGTQTTTNLAAMVSLVPLTGVPLPFISYGGSALLVNLVAIGILLNISKSAKARFANAE